MSSFTGLHKTRLLDMALAVKDRMPAYVPDVHAVFEAITKARLLEKQRLRLVLLLLLLLLLLVLPLLLVPCCSFAAAAAVFSCRKKRSRRTTKMRTPKLK